MEQKFYSIIALFANLPENMFWQFVLLFIFVHLLFQTLLSSVYHSGYHARYLTSKK